MGIISVTQSEQTDGIIKTTTFSSSAEEASKLLNFMVAYECGMHRKSLTPDEEFWYRNYMGISNPIEGNK